MKGIIFSTPMVQAILQGRKTQTRRIIKQIRTNDKGNVDFDFKNHSGRNIPKEDINSALVGLVDNAPYKVGDVLYVKETYQHTDVLNIHPTDDNYGYVYKADGQPWEDFEGWKWKSPMFMPEKAARLFIVITGIKVERLQDISEEDAIKEGVERDRDGWKGYDIIEKGPHKGKPHPFNAVPYKNAVLSFYSFWQSINGQESLDQNPWVWAYTFEIYEP